MPLCVICRNERDGAYRSNSPKLDTDERCSRCNRTAKMEREDFHE
jgi:hypothetical protein